MEILALWGFVRRRWWLMLLPAIVAFILLIPSLSDVWAAGTSYSVAMRFTAAAPADAVLDTTYEDSVYVPWLASEYVVVNLPQWVTSDSFAREVSAELVKHDMDIPFQDVRPAFAADSARSVMVIYINWDDAAEIEALANAAVTVLQTRNQIYFPQFAAHPAEVVALDDVRVNSVPTALMTRLNPLIRLAVALAAGVGLAAAVEYFDDMVRSEDDLRALGLSVFGVIPAE